DLCSTRTLNIMTASKGLRPALLFLSSAASLTTASISARKLSKGTRALSASSGSPLALIASRRLSRSKKPGCPTAFPCAADVGTRESDLRRARQCYFSRCPYANDAGSKSIVVMPILSLKVVEDMATAYAWLYQNGMSLGTIDLYFAMLRH